MRSAPNVETLGCCQASLRDEDEILVALGFQLAVSPTFRLRGAPIAHDARKVQGALLHLRSTGAIALPVQTREFVSHQPHERSHCFTAELKSATGSCKQFGQSPRSTQC